MKFRLSDIKPQIDWMDNNIEEEDIENIKIYTSDVGYKINRFLRASQPLSEAVKGIDKLFSQIPPLDSSIVLYRSIDFDLGKSYKDLGFISTTYDLETIYEPIKESHKPPRCCILEITIPSGSKVIPAYKYSVNPHEKEILLNRGSHMFVTNEVIQGGYKFLHVLYTPPEMIPTQNLKQIETVNEKLDRESVKLLKYLIKELDFLYDETVELDGGKEDFWETIQVQAKEYQKKTEILDMTVETVLNSKDLHDKIKTYKF